MARLEGGSCRRVRGPSIARPTARGDEASVRSPQRTGSGAGSSARPNRRALGGPPRLPMGLPRHPRHDDPGPRPIRRPGVPPDRAVPTESDSREPVPSAPPRSTSAPTLRTGTHLEGGVPIPPEGPAPFYAGRRLCPLRGWAEPRKGPPRPRHIGPVRRPGALRRAAPPGSKVRRPRCSLPRGGPGPEWLGDLAVTFRPDPVPKWNPSTRPSPSAGLDPAPSAVSPRKHSLKRH